MLIFNRLLLAVSHSSNIAIYCLSSKSFRRFLYLKLSGIRAHVSSEHTEHIQNVSNERLLDRFNHETIDPLFSTARTLLNIHQKLESFCAPNTDKINHLCLIELRNPMKLSAGRNTSNLNILSYLDLAVNIPPFPRHYDPISELDGLINSSILNERKAKSCLWSETTFQ